MSIVRHTESSGNSYAANYTKKNKGRDKNSLASHLLQKDNRMFGFTQASFLSGVTDDEFLSSSNQQVEVLYPSTPEITGSPYSEVYSPFCWRSDGPRLANVPNQYGSRVLATTTSSTSWDKFFSHNSGTVSCSQSLEVEMGYENTETKSKLEELERVLLTDTDVGYLDGSGYVGISDDWIQPVKDLVMRSSTKESTSNSDASTSERSQETKSSKKLLFDCAASIAEENFEEATAIIAELRGIVSIYGDPPLRLAAYLMEGLVARMSCSGIGIYKALRCKEPPSSDRLSAMQVLFEVCPCFKFGFMAANGAISEVLENNKKVHIVDFDVNQGSQYFSLLQSLAKCNRKPLLRITGVDDPESVQREVGGLNIIGLRLKEFAEELGIPFQFHSIAARTADVTEPMLGCRPNEALVVNFAYQLHHMPDESVSTVNERDRLLHMVKRLHPKLVTVIEHDINTNTAPFFTRFVEVYNFYNAIFESLDATLPRDSFDRMNVEMQCLAKDMMNIIACEGSDRIERYEAAGKWKARMTMAGFVSSPMSSHVNKEIRANLKLYGDRYKLVEEAGSLYFGWQDKILVVASAWR